MNEDDYILFDSYFVFFLLIIITIAFLSLCVTKGQYASYCIKGNLGEMTDFSFIHQKVECNYIVYNIVNDCHENKWGEKECVYKAKLPTQNTSPLQLTTTSANT